MELKNKVVSGVAWTATEKFISTVLQLCVSLIIARLLTPSDFGLIAILTVFMFISNSIIDSGFSTALVRKAHPTTEDYSSVFYFNVVVSLVLYAILCLVSYPIAEFYKEPQLVKFAPVLFAIIPVNAMGIVQNAVMQKTMDFRKMATQNLIAACVSGAVAIYLAANGWGAWALVFQMLTMSVVRIGIMWLRSSWRPLKSFTIAPIKEFWSYSSRIFLTSLLNNVFNNISQLFIGKVYNSQQLGLYYQAQKLKELPLSSIITAVLSVSLPAFSSLQNDAQKLRDASRKVMITLAFIIYPLMIGLIAIAPELFNVLLTEKWAASVPYFQILCLSALFVPVSETYVNLFMLKSSGNKVLNVAIVRKIFFALMLVVTIPISVKAIAWGQVVCLAFDTFMYTYFSKRHIAKSVTAQAREIIPYLLLTAAMYIAVISVNWIFPHLDQIWILIIKIAVGAVTYLGLAHMFRMEAWVDTSEILKGLIKKLTA